MQRFILGFYVACVILLFGCTAQPKEISNILYDYTEPQKIEKSVLETSSEISDLIVKRGDVLIYQGVKDNDIIIATYDLSDKTERFLYESSTVFSISNVEVFEEELVFCEVFNNSAESENPLYFCCCKLSKNGKRELFRDECIKIPSISKAKGRSICVNYQKLEGTSINSFVIVGNIEKAGDFTEIASAKIQTRADGTLFGYALLGMSTFDEKCFFQKISLEGVQGLEHGRKTEVLMFDIKKACTETIYKSPRLLFYMSASDDYFLGVDYYYDIPEKEHETSWVSDLSCLQKYYFPESFVAHEVFDSCWLSASEVIAQNYSTVYFIDFLNSEMTYWDIPTEGGSLHTNVLFENGKFYAICFDEGKYNFVEYSDFQHKYDELPQHPAEGQESITCEILIDYEPVPENGIVYVKTQSPSLVVSEKMNAMEIREEDGLTGFLENHILEITSEYNETSYDGTVVRAVRYDIENMGSYSAVKIKISDELASRVGLKTSEIILISEDK